jgi:hypothetical protein
LIAIGLALTLAPTRAAVMTTSASVSSGLAPYKIAYILAQDAQTMTVKIHKASDKTVIRTFTASGAGLTKGVHTGDVTWDGKTDGGATAAAADYYAEIVTTGAPNSTLTALAGPVAPVDPLDPTINNGRFQYNSAVNRNADSPYHNYIYAGSGRAGAGNLTQISGVWMLGADLSVVKTVHTSTLLGSGDGNANDWLAVSATPDGAIIASGQTSGKVVQLNPDLTLNKIYPAGGTVTKITTRANQAFGTAAAPKLYYVDTATTGVANVGGVNVADLSPAVTPVPAKVVDTNLFNGAGRAFAFNKAETSVWLAEDGAGAGYTTVQKWDKPTDGTTLWVQDTSFVPAMPDFIPTTSRMRGLVLSPDEATVWYSVFDTVSTTPSNQNVIVGIDAKTGASKGAAYMLDSTQLDFGYPLGMGISDSGNLVVYGYPGTYVGQTSGNSVMLLAPPDSGSTDTTISTNFTVAADTSVRFTAGPTLSNTTFQGATFTWDTNFPADSVIKYGASADNLNQTFSQDTTPTVLHHAVILTGLEKNTPYFYQVVSNAAGLTSATSSVGTFTTLPLTISNVQVVPGDTFAIVNWTTNDASTSIVHYGVASGTLDQTATAAGMVTNHSVTITGLAATTPYFYSVESGAATAPPTPTVTAEASFTTVVAGKVIAEDVAVTTTSAVVSFTTDVAATGEVKWGTAPGALTNTIAAGSGTTHSAPISGLSAGTTYYYNISIGTTVAPFTSLTAPFTTAGVTSAAVSVTHSSAADFGPTLRTNVLLGAAGGISLQKQGSPSPAQYLTDLPSPRYYEAVTAHNGYLYVLGGRDSVPAAQTTVFVSKINTDGTVGAWSETTALPETRAFICNHAFGYNGYLYLIGGAGGANGDTMPTAYYAKQNADGTLGAWNTTTPLPSERDLAAVTVVDGYAVVSGGEDNAGTQYATNYMAQIHPDGTLGAWITGKPMEHPKWMLRSASNNHTLYSIGGFQTAVDFWSYAAKSFVQPDSSLQGFTQGGAMDAAHYGMACALVGGKIITAGGRLGGDSPHMLVSTTKIGADDATQDWVNIYSDSDLSALPVPVCDLDGTAYQDNFYAVGGRQTFGQADCVPSVTMFHMAADPSDSGYVYAGTLESKVVDFGAVQNLKRLTVVGSGANTSNVEVRYRSALAAGGPFTDWFTLGSLDGDISGAARFVQYQLSLKASGGANGNDAAPSITSVTVSTAAAAGLAGDVNKDGAVTSDDVKAALRIVGGLTNANDASVSKPNADVVADGKVTVEDAVKILRIVTGK